MRNISKWKHRGFYPLFYCATPGEVEDDDICSGLNYTSGGEVENVALLSKTGGE